MIKKFASLFLLLTISCNARLWAQNLEGQPIAAQYGAYQITGSQDETSNTGFTFTLGTCQVSGGGQNFSGFAAGVPVKIVDANPALTEVATPSAVNIDTCTVTVTTAHSHQLPYFLTSGTGGLQEAITANGTGEGANSIVLNAEWYALIPPTSAATVIGEVAGNSNLALVDITTAPYTWYTWNGVHYAAVPGGGTGPASLAVTSTFSINGVNMFGDSITKGIGAALYQNAYAGILSTAFGPPAVNYGVSGSWATDVSTNQVYPNLNPTRYGNIPSTLLIGTNDAATCGLTSGCENNYSHAMTSMIGWATIPLEYKIQPQLGITSGNCTTTGTWTNVSFGNVLGIQSIVPGSTITCTSLTSGDPAVYANWYAKDGLTSTATFSIDGTQVDTWDSFGFNGQVILTGNGIGTTQVAFGTRYPLSGSGSHTYKVTVATAGASNAFTLLWIGSPAPKTILNLGNQTQNPPRMAVGGVIRQEADAQSANTSFYNSLALSIATQFATDGAYVFPVNVRNYVDLDYATLDSDMEAATLPNGLATIASTSPGAHPNGSVSNGVQVGGHRHLADAFLAAMPPPPSTLNQQSRSLSPYFVYFDDYYGGESLATASIGSPTGNACSTNQANASTDLNHPGNLTVSSGTVTSAGEACSPITGFHGLLAGLNSAPGWTWESLVYESNTLSTSNSAYQAGMANTLPANPWTTGIGFSASSANAVQNDWYCEYGTTYTDTGVTTTPGVWARLTIVSNGSTVSWYVNDQPTSAGCSNIPVANLPSFGTVMVPAAFTSVSLTASTSYTLYVDTTYFQRNVNR
jgi:hypothetical protein